MEPNEEETTSTMGGRKRERPNDEDNVEEQKDPPARRLRESANPPAPAADNVLARQAAQNCTSIAMLLELKSCVFILFARNIRFSARLFFILYFPTRNLTTCCPLS